MLRTITILTVVLCSAVGAMATPFVNPISGPAGDGSYDPGYTPSYSIYFSGSLWTVDTDLDGYGDDGVFTVGDRNRAAADAMNASGWNPGISQRGFNVFAANGQPDGETSAPIVNNDPFPSWDPDTPDGDPTWPGSGSERYGMELALGAGSYVLAAIYDDANDSDPDSNGGLLPGDEWTIGLWPWVNNPTRTPEVRPYAGTFSSFIPVFTDLGALDRLDVTGTLIESDGAWNVDYDGSAPDDESYVLATSTFTFSGTLYETGNTFLIDNPLGGGGQWRLNEWAGTSVVTPIPEPAGLVLLGIGGLALLRRHRQRS